MVERLSVLPLGGCGEIGLNATLLMYGGDALLIDCGALLGVWDAPGVDRAVPGFEPLFQPGRRLVGVVLTHGHEDHIGALPALMQEVEAPVMGTPTTVAFAKSRLERSPVERRAQERLTEVPLGGRVTLGPFQVEWISVTHSIPESAAILVETPGGRVLHSGDFKLDAHPVVGPPTDVARLSALGDEGVDLLLSDSTNAESGGRTVSEQVVAQEIDKIIQTTQGRVIVSLFASHLHRIRAAVDGALRHGRRVLLAGRSLERTWQLGVGQGILPDDPTLLLTPEGAAARPRREVLVLATGTQGELSGGLSRIAAGRDGALRPQVGDRVVMSARTIPGNEKPVRRVLNQLCQRGIEVVSHRMVPVHCSGHAHSEEQAELIRMIRPRHFVPIHGEQTMLAAHARLAEEVGGAQVHIVENGQSLWLHQGESGRGPGEAVSKRMVDPSGRILDWGDVRDRRRLGKAGLLICVLVLSPSGRTQQISLDAHGVTLRPQDRVVLKETVEAALEVPLGGVEARVQATLRAVAKRQWGTAPCVVVNVVQLQGRG